MAGGQELPEPAVRRQQGFVQRVLRPPERYVPDEGLRQRGLFGRLLLPRGEAERAGLPERRRLRGGAAHHRPGAVPRTGRGQPDRRDGGNRGLSEIAARAGRKGRRCRGSRNGHGRGGCVRRPSRTEALPGGGEALHRGGACLLGRIGHHRGGAAPLRDGIARRVPGRDEGGQGVRLQFHPGGTDVRVQGEMGREGLSPDVGGALRLWRAHGLEQLPSKGDLLFLTGGEKDVLTLAAHGFHAICFNSETSVIPAKTVRKLVYRFKHIVLLYDTDKTGLECSEKHRAQLAEYGVKRLVLPLSGTKAEKDVTDYFKAGHTREELMGLFLKLLDTLYGDTLAMLKSCEIDYDHPPEQAVAIVTAGDVPLGSEENILCITGGEGTGKSNYTAALVAGAIMERETDADLLGVRVEPNRKGRAVLLYDTEQSEQQLHKNTGRLLRRAGRERMPEYLHVYCLTGMSRSERLTAIVQSMDRYHYLHGGIHLVVIDGVADLIRCANDEAESVALIDEIYRLAGIYRTCRTD